MSYKIITHNGKAHMDELLGCALLTLHLGVEPESIERMDAQDAAQIVSGGNLPDDTYFIDCGLVFDDKRKLYDHHQDRELDSAALLMFNEFFPQLRDTELHNFIKLVSRVDTRGPMSLDDFNLVSESRDYLSFGHKILLLTFEKDPMLILKIIAAGLEDKIQFEKARQKAALWLKETGHIEIIKIAELNILKYLINPPSELVSPLRSAITEVVDENNISAILSFDDKQPGVLTFYRTDSGHNLVDFSQCKPAETIFNHQGGFLMKFKPSDEQEWMTLVQQAGR
jgi:hypothetical protein